MVYIQKVLQNTRQATSLILLIIEAINGTKPNVALILLNFTLNADGNDYLFALLIHTPYNRVS